MEKVKSSGFFALLKEKRVTTVAGAWVYFFLSSLIPMLFLFVTAFGVFGVEITTDLVSRLPEGLREGGEMLVDTAKSIQEGVTVLFVFTAVFSASALLNQMRIDGNSIYGVCDKKRRGILNRVWAVFALLVLFCIFLLTAFIVAFGERIFLLIPMGRGRKIIATIFAGLVITGVSYLVIVLLNKYICPAKTPIFSILSGSLLSLAIVFTGTFLMGVYLNAVGLTNAFYGSLAGIVVFLLWVYIMMTGLVVGTIFGYYLDQRSIEKMALS